MASLSYNSCSRNYHNFLVECRPKMLKDFLVDDSNSCSSSGFKSFPRKPCDSSVKALIEIDINNKTIANPSNNATNNYKLLRSRSKAAASTTVSALQAMINAVKSTAVKSPSMLPRSLSRRSRSKKKSQNKENHEVKFIVTVKDIIRWTSFRDVAEEKSPPFDLASPPHHCVTTTTGSTSTTPCSSRSMGSSWCDSDFTSEYLPSWNGPLEECDENVEEVGKKFLPRVGEYCMEASIIETTACTAAGSKEEQQHSPVSVIEFKFEEDEEYSSSSFDQSLATVESTKQKIMEKIRRFESVAKLDTVNIEKWMSMDENISSEEDDDRYNHNVDGKANIRCEREEEEEEEINEAEEKAWKLLNHVKETSSEYCYINADYLLLDLFRAESARMGYDELLDKAKAWMNGEDSFLVTWEVEHKREASVRDMEREGRWSKFEKEREELGLDIENELVGVLVDEILHDLISSPVSLKVQ